MSEEGPKAVEAVYEVQDLAGPSASLAERARLRRQQLAAQTTVRLEVPLYEGLLAVEYRALEYGHQRRIAERLRNVKDDGEREIYIAADQLITASVNAYEMNGGGVREIGVGWGTQLAKHLGVEDAEDMTPRQAMLACFSPRVQLLVVHFGEYTEWLAGATIDIDEEQRPDFQGRRSQTS